MECRERWRPPHTIWWEGIWWWECMSDIMCVLYVYERECEVVWIIVFVWWMMFVCRNKMLILVIASRSYIGPNIYQVWVDVYRCVNAVICVYFYFEYESCIFLYLDFCNFINITASEFLFIIQYTEKYAIAYYTKY